MLTTVKFISSLRQDLQMKQGCIRAACRLKKIWSCKSAWNENDSEELVVVETDLFRGPSRKPTISEIANARVRGLLRGLLSKDLNTSTLQTLNRLRKSANPRDWQRVSEILLLNPLFAHLPFPAPFPPKPVFPSQNFILETQPLTNELIHQSTRLYINEEAIGDQAQSFIKLNQLLSLELYEEAIVALLKAEASYGYSLFLLSKAAYIYSNKSLSDDVLKPVKGLLDRYGLSGRNVISLGLVDMMDNSYELLPLRRNLLEFAASRKTDEITREIVRWQVAPVSTSSAEISARLNALGSYSLFDAFVFIGVHHFNLDIFSDLPSIPNLSGLFPDRLRTVWDALSGAQVPLATEGYKGPDPEFDDQDIYRRSIAWIENKDVSRFRAVADHLYTNATSRPIKSAVVEDLCRTYFSTLKSIDELAADRQEFAVDLTRYNNEGAGVFVRTLALIHLVTSSSYSSHAISTDVLMRIMDRTRDVAGLLNASEIQEQFDSGNDSLMHKYIVSALLSESLNTSGEKHKLRRVFQDLVIREYGGDIIKLAEFFQHGFPNLAGHLVFICTEDFLVQLYFLISEASEVFERRAELLEWYGENFNEPTMVERARTIRLDQRLQKVRGQIDDTRLYVDPVRFGQWFDDNHLDEISSLLRGNIIDVAQIEGLKDFGDFTTQRQPHVRLAVVLQSAFQEFCSNKRYGINSYLGRRIRHGTLSGFMCNAVEETIKEERFRSIRENPHAMDALQSWVESYRFQVETWANDILHIQDKQHARGAIRSNILDLDKIEVAKSAMRVVQEQYHKHGVFSVAAQVVYEYCWRLLETDLSKIRPMIERAHLSWGSIDQARFLEACPEELGTLGIGLCRAINAKTNDVFRTVSGWFTKPVNLSPSAPISILIEAVLEEVKGHFGDFKPKIISLGIPDIELVGAFYHHMYDFLYAVIHNAARHGARDGTIETDLRLTHLDAAYQKLYVGITSTINDSDSIDKVISIIESRIAEVSEDAMVVEGNSGIKKIVRLPIDVEEVLSTDFSASGNKITVSIEMRLARM